MNRDTLKTLLIACLTMVLVSTLVNGLLINLLLLPSHQILVQQLSAGLAEFGLLLVLSLAVLMACSVKYQRSVQ